MFIGLASSCDSIKSGSTSTAAKSVPRPGLSLPFDWAAPSLDPERRPTMFGTCSCSCEKASGNYRRRRPGWVANLDLHSLQSSKCKVAESDTIPLVHYVRRSNNVIIGLSLSVGVVVPKALRLL
jgi:hypothetical protein